MENLVGGKTVNLTLVGLDSNAYVLMGSFQRQARKEGWTKEEIDVVLDACKSGDYDNLLCVLMEHCEEEDEDDNQEFDRDEYYDRNY